MRTGRAILLLLLAVLIGVPIALAPRESRDASAAARTLVIFTPHNENIRHEFARAFEAWHLKTYGEHVQVAWSTPGGTSEIRKMLEAAYLADLRRGEEVGGQGDLLFGGGSYEFMQLSRELSIDTPSGKRSTTVFAPIEFDQATLSRIYGDTTTIGDTPLYDAKGMWYGAALSGFGIVYNRDVLRELGVAEPAHWIDLCDPRLVGWVALVNPAQSGSVATAYEAILQRRGWIEGWQILRRMAANARTFSASAPKAPTDVSLGEAAAGVCIDFYGRYQSQAMIDAGDTRDGDDARVGYVDPSGETVIDPDPIAMLRGAPHPELARRFVEFTLSREGQALWQFRAQSRQPSTDGLGPRDTELRRMPVRRAMYATDLPRFVDQVDPWTIATAVEKQDPSFRAFLPVLFVAMAIENRALLREAWLAIVQHPAYPRNHAGIVGADDVTDSTLREMLQRFDALPEVAAPGGEQRSLADPANLAAVKAGWLKSGWKNDGLWPVDAAPAEVLRAQMTAFFRSQYESIVRLGRSGTS